MALASGGFLVLSYLGVVPWRPPRRCRAVFCDPYHWPILCFGVGFAAMGVLVLLGEAHPRASRLVAAAGGLSFLAALGGTVAAM